MNSDITRKVRVKNVGRRPSLRQNGVKTLGGIMPDEVMAPVPGSGVERGRRGSGGGGIGRGDRRSGRGRRGSGRGGCGARGRGSRSHDEEVPSPSSMEVDDWETFSPAVPADVQVAEVPAQERLPRPGGSGASRGTRGSGGGDVGRGGRGSGKRGRGARSRGSEGHEDELPSPSSEVGGTTRGRGSRGHEDELSSPSSEVGGTTRGRGSRGHDEEVPSPSSMEVDDWETFSPAVPADVQVAEVSTQERLPRPGGSGAARGSRGSGGGDVGRGGRGSGKRGRGARSRGSRGHEDELPSHSSEVGGATRGRGGRAPVPPLRGGRVSCRGKAAARKPSRPTAIDKLQLKSVDLLPRGTPLEQPLHPKKRRAWDPLNPSLAPGVTGEVEVMEVEKEQRLPHAGALVQAQGPSPSPGPSQSPAFPPSPALFLECPADSSRTSTPCHVQPTCKPPRRPLRDIDIEEHLNDGSESDDSEAEDDEYLVPILVSRVLMGAMDTPLDEAEANQPLDEAEANQPLDEGPSVPLADGEEGAVRPNDFFSFEWRNFPDPPIPPLERREPFTAVDVGPTVVCQDPYSIFVSIWDEQIMQHIVEETNKYAQDIVQKKMRENTLAPRSRICDWQDTSVDELYTYFAIILAMGIVIKSRIEEYWTRDAEIFSTPGFKACMSLSKFQLLSTCLHFNDNRDINGRELSQPEAKLFKIEPIIAHLNAKFQSMYTMDRNIALDESLMQWKGWLSINQFISNKAAKVGVKTYEVCESQTGYLWRFDVHAGKKNPPQEKQTPLDASTPTIVLDLLRGLEGKGYTVWMDNFYNSPALARQLKVLGFDVVGTLRTNRQFVPQELTDLTKSNMRKGQITGFTSGDVDVMVWRDENRVATISTYHGDETGVSDGVVKPCLILDYNIMMGGVDKKDQLLSMYPIERKRTRVWYKKFFRRLLNVSTSNSLVIAKKSGSNINHRDFRKNLIKSLLSRHSKPRQMPLSAENHVFLAKTHYILQHVMGTNKSRLRRKCSVCGNLSHFYCAGCDKTVCIGTCFVSLHS